MSRKLIVVSIGIMSVLSFVDMHPDFRGNSCFCFQNRSTNQGDCVSFRDSLTLEGGTDK